MASFSPLVSILNQNKLTRSNYVDWKRNLDIVFTAEVHKYVLTQPCPNFPSLDAPLEEKQRYDRWQKSNEMVKCYILASISNMFGEQGHSARQETMRQIYNTKMAAGSSVREHCLRMIANLNTLEVLGADIDGESQVDMILQSLPESFKEFRLNYNMNKKIYSLSELMNELVAAEGILGTSSVEANVGEASTSQPKSKGKDKKKKKKDFTKKDGKQIALGVANKGKKTKGKCFHCGEKGHWKRNCPTYKASKNKGMKSSFLLEICLVQNPTDSWCVDSGCTNHICNSLQRFQETRKLNEGELFLTLADGSKIPVEAIGVFNLCFKSRVLILEDCLYVPNVLGI
ncbi:hypothetical protein ACB092_11G120000 [Castanea dentata]